MPTYDNKKYIVEYNSTEFPSGVLPTNVNTYWTKIYNKLFNLASTIDCEEGSHVVFTTSSQVHLDMEIKTITRVSYAGFRQLWFNFKNDDGFWRTLVMNLGTNGQIYARDRNGLEVTLSSTELLKIVSKSFFALVATTLKIVFMKNTAEKNRVDKTNYLTNVRTYWGNFKDATSITNPVIIVDWSLDLYLPPDEYFNIPEINYVYIESLNRYYFIEDIISVRKGLWQLRLKVDVLMSFKDKILQQKGYISRNEWEYNEFIVDSERIALNQPDIRIIERDDVIFNSPMGITESVISYKED